MVIVKRMIMALAVIVMLTANAYATVDGSLFTTEFEGWDSTNYDANAEALGIQLTGNWSAYNHLFQMNLPGPESPKMTFVNGATYISTVFDNWQADERWLLEFDGDVNSRLLPTAYRDASVDGNLVEIVMPETLEEFTFSLAGLTLNSITFLGTAAGDYGGTDFYGLAYVAAPTPIPGSVLLLLSSLVGMVGIRRFVA